MSRQQVNEAISAWFEPKPQAIPDQDSDSPQLYWRFYGGEWRAYYDVYTDEAANARLLEAMPYPEVQKHKHGLWWVRMDYTRDTWVVNDPDRKTAVVMAFCKFAGIEQPRPPEAD